jgi:polyisoprenoid-binding protein YceI
MTTETLATAIPTGTWTVDPAHSSVEFQVKHLGIATVKGHFHEFEGALEVGADGVPAKAYGTVKAASVDTREEQRDAHLRSADFFDAEQHAELRFASTAIEQVDDERYAITGELTIHGVTRTVTLDAELQGLEQDPWGNERVAVEVTGTIKRGDFGMTFNQALGSGNMLVGDKVKLALDISAVRGS